MKRLHRSLFILPLLLSLACGAVSEAATPTTTAWAGPPSVLPSTATAGPTAGPSVPPAATEDACAPGPLRAYLQAFAIPMAFYEFSLANVFSLTMTKASKDKLTAAIDQTQTSRDSLASTPAPYCAQKMQAAMLSSMDHTIAGLKLNVAGENAQAEFNKAQSDLNVVQMEFGTLTAKAGMQAGSTPTP